MNSESVVTCIIPKKCSLQNYTNLVKILVLPALLLSQISMLRFQGAQTPVRLFSEKVIICIQFPSQLMRSIQRLSFECLGVRTDRNFPNYNATKAWLFSASA